MATRAFLLCGDEKAVHAISQILDELEVSFEHSSEPPFALKRLPAQRFDLLIVDCDNAQNATQVFNIARASSLNKNSIAIAIVEGKAGVPNAFRLGASLVLTKPVSLEQARNTLRTGVGMTKKDGPETKATASAPAIPHATTPVTAAPPAPVHVNPPAPQLQPSAAATSVPPHVIPASPVTPSPATPPPAAKTPTAPLVPATPTPATGTPATSSILPATASADTKPAPAASVEKPAVAPKAASVAPPPPETKPVANSATETKVPSIVAAPVAKAAAAATSTAPTTSTSTSASPSVGKADAISSASVTTPDKKAPEAEKKSYEPAGTNSTVLKIEDPLADELDALDPLKDHGVPSFGALSREPFAGLETDKPRRSKLPLVAALVLVLLGGGAYAAWLTQPNFRALMISEFGNAKTKVDAMRGKEPVATAAKPQPAPVAPAPAQPTAPVATQNSENIDVSMTPNGTTSDSTADPNANNAPATTPADTATNSTGTPTTGNASTTNATEPAVPTPATATKADATKQPKLQSAKQNATPGKSAALVPASLPPTTTAKAPSSDLLEVPEDFADDQVIHRVHPTYPKQALTKKLHGSVTLQVIVNKQGKVDSLALVSGDPVLGQAAQSAVKQWRYKPYWHNGEPTDFQTHVTVDFKLP
jgi:TonB family protein